MYHQVGRRCDNELEALKELTELYPDTFFQGTPAMEKKMASAILKGC